MFFVRNSYYKLKEEIAMIQIIAGEKGKGKTKHLIDRVNKAVESSTGNVIFLDKSTRHMYEVSNKVRLINVTDYPFITNEGFVGFLYGILSQDHDIEDVFIDSFLKVANVDETNISHTIEEISNISKLYNINFTLSVSFNEEKLPDDVKEYVVVSL
mgnify:CR=1 FL=1